ncbi:hypothetical protein EDD99_3730 [Streptomyces sp. 846.5]|nr:hypothetical protein [Streptomyces sp. 846.5]TDU05225.1 hypothetical protein EDD99_3730 [Streptomyces sp. 846.5]
MAVNLSAVLVFGAALLFMLRARTLGAGAALVALLFGFYLARTGAAPLLSSAVSSVFTALSHIH